MENVEIIESIRTKLFAKNSKQSELKFVFSVKNATKSHKKQLVKKNQVSRAPPLRGQCSHDIHIKFHHKRSMCHHRRKLNQMRQGHETKDFSVAKMLNRSKRIFTITTKMWDI